MPKPVSPLVGFNNNVKHKGRIFHVQTEDSGINRPRIVTHLFADGGRIIKSTRTDYSEHVGRKDMAVVVRRLMKEQHKAMFIALRDGQFDESIAQAMNAPPRDSSHISGSMPRPPSLSDVQLSDLAVPSTLSTEPAPIPRRPVPTLSELSLADIGAPREHVVARRESVSVEVPGADEIAEVEERSATEAKGMPALDSSAVRPNATPGRYAAPRPAAIFSDKAPEDGGSIFGGSSISEQSLDEVILSYLAEDLDGAPPDD